MEQITKKLQEQLNKMAVSGKLFRSKVLGHEVWDLYLSSFPKEHNGIFRDPASSEHNCNHCHSFIRRYGNIVAINEDYSICSIFDIELEVGSEYYDSLRVMSTILKNSPIGEVFFETFNELNTINMRTSSR